MKTREWYLGYLTCHYKGQFKHVIDSMSKESLIRLYEFLETQDIPPIKFEHTKYMRIL